MHKILVVEDEEGIRVGLVDMLELEGYQIQEASDGETAIQIAKNWAPDLVILDLMLPNKNGFDVCRYLRKQFPDIFILMLTAKNEEINKLSGFKMGADDYMTKPFSIMELLARIKSMLRRKDSKLNQDVLVLADIHIDFKSYEATKNGVPIDFSSKEIQILKFLNERRGEVVTREDLLQHIWGYTADNMPITRTVDNQIVKLRQKIEPDANNPQFITSIRGVGYKFEDKTDN